MNASSKPVFRVAVTDNDMADIECMAEQCKNVPMMEAVVGYVAELYPAVVDVARCYYGEHYTYGEQGLVMRYGRPVSEPEYIHSKTVHNMFDDKGRFIGVSGSLVDVMEKYDDGSFSLKQGEEMRVSMLSEILPPESLEVALEYIGEVDVSEGLTAEQEARFLEVIDAAKSEVRRQAQWNNNADKVQGILHRLWREIYAAEKIADKMPSVGVNYTDVEQSTADTIIVQQDKENEPNLGECCGVPKELPKWMHQGDAVQAWEELCKKYINRSQGEWYFFGTDYHLAFMVKCLNDGFNGGRHNWRAFERLFSVEQLQRTYLDTEYKEDDEVVKGIIGVIVRRGAAVSCCE